MLRDLILEELTKYKGTLHQRIFNIIKKNILEHKIPNNAKLPSSRALSQELGISRNTILLVYEQLELEGYVFSKKNSGTFVKNNLKFISIKPSFHINPSERGQKLLDNHYVSKTMKKRLLTPFLPDTMAFPHKKFNKIISKIRNTLDEEDLTYSSDGGVLHLKQMICEHLKTSRFISCKPDQVLLFNSSNDALNLISKILCNHNDLIWVENPSYWGFKNIFQTAGLKVKEVNVDEHGLNFEKMTDITDSSPSLILVTPSRQYPLGYIMSLERRLKLLNYASENNIFIIEDDYDSDFRLSKYQISSLFGLKQNVPVIYLGSFSKTIYPAIHISYLVIPENLISILSASHSVLYRNSDRIMQKALAQFMQNGDYNIHLNNIRTLYTKRRQYLIFLINSLLGPEFIDNEYNTNPGLHLIISLPNNIDDQKLVTELNSYDINVTALSKYYSNTPCPKGLLVGFAHLTEEDMENPVKILASIILKYL